jgi:hypothetical protein
MTVAVRGAPRLPASDWISRGETQRFSSRNDAVIAHPDVDERERIVLLHRAERIGWRRRRHG